MSNNITIYTGNIEKLKDKRGEFALTEAAGKEIKKLLAAREALDNTLEQVQGLLEEEMSKQNVKLIVKDDLKITRTVNGRRFAFDPSKKVDSRFTKKVSYFNPNTEEIEEFIVKNKRVPSGILESARKTSVKIEIINETD